eukprot:CAMPEP_0198215090 /NCGR_PEP_ID=MMETSP1445-20131203/46952_1 /TAXON_ID=36898 /ORGANISM="Pyramimonas sp., Strain CCMP2087" /LENGTH=165 /DNA_ID=CAMNT_0043890633 /DNA_START=282 /DNA_END=776 /DNA_ORIENTATION=+
MYRSALEEGAEWRSKYDTERRMNANLKKINEMNENLKTNNEEMRVSLVEKEGERVPLLSRIEQLEKDLTDTKNDLFTVQSTMKEQVKARESLEDTVREMEAITLENTELKAQKEALKAEKEALKAEQQQAEQHQREEAQKREEMREQKREEGLPTSGQVVLNPKL